MSVSHNTHLGVLTLLAGIPAPTEENCYVWDSLEEPETVSHAATTISWSNELGLVLMMDMYLLKRTSGRCGACARQRPHGRWQAPS